MLRAGRVMRDVRPADALARSIRSERIIIMLPLRIVFSAILLVNSPAVLAFNDPSASLVQNKRLMDAEALVYKRWYDAFKGRTLPEAIKLGEAYLQEYPNGKYGGYISKIIDFARISLNKEKIAQANALRSSIHASIAKEATQLEFLLKEALNGTTHVNTTTPDGRTPLMFAASERTAEEMEALLEKGASVNVIENTQGWTALVYAIWAGDRNLLRRLLQYYPDATIKDREGRTALDHAILSADFEMMLLILGRPMPGISS